MIVDGTGHAAYKTMNSDATINSAGVLTIGNEKVTPAKIAALAIEASKLAAEAVETAKIKNLAVTEAKLAALAVTAAKLAAEAVETGKIKERAVTSAKIALLAITTELIADGAVTSRKFKPTIGTKQTTEFETAVGAAYADIAGTELAITPEVASWLKIFATIQWGLTTAGSAAVASVALMVDGVQQTPTYFTRLAAPSTWGAGSFNNNGEYGQPCFWLVSLTAAAHTIKLQAKHEAGSTVSVGAGTGYLYELVAK